MKKIVRLFIAVCAAAAISSCSTEFSDAFDGAGEKGDYESGYMASDGDVAPGEGGGDMGEGGEGDTSQNNGQAGRVTAGEWNDLDNWTFWSGLMTGEEYSSKSSYWCFWTNNRVAVEVSDKEENPVAGVTVTLSSNGKDVWSTKTDNFGRADCWVGMLQKTEEVAGLKLTVNGQPWEGEPAVTTWDCPNGVAMNRIVLENAVSAAAKADIAFFVDATGSMMDEIDFLKEDLLDILNKVEASQGGVAFRTAALFYRDEGDAYVTRTSNFSDKFSTTVDYIKKQTADGGGDYPEAVHTALEKGLQDLSWDESAKTRIAFMLLDAPAHHNETVIASLQKSIVKYAENGIKIIPIAASGADKDTEFMLRFFAVATGGTYVFITNDSGIGGDHIAASVGEYQVELLNELIIRLIKKYTD
ncbi:MAG: hypothetical protein J5675_01200 [Bacteroidales bacterium]|nr:hypothetical protein [Bacteroidales bacterium]